MDDWAYCYSGVIFMKQAAWSGAIGLVDTFIIKQEIQK